MTERVQFPRVCFASPFRQGERIEVRGSEVVAGMSLFRQPSTLPLSLAKGEATVASTGALSAQPLPENLINSSP